VIRSCISKVICESLWGLSVSILLGIVLGHNHMMAGPLCNGRDRLRAL
jgi:hypothetical protein